ncbi:MerR family transcriptional regulator [Salipiger sp. 1_MG-2023]|uniref:MerR family transcriptional regulator n=1 Tax=Salipiger sp. 1_MG-2023 TaxID=3062665 RepID=UPI0026E22C3A|nr:MerR family transcriptional regulator [Salipiger sp. 1_MG-2023]MDO6585780.1 MerR family transcriptional regulator [Salipiger sp. 1_MG-2023]
MNKSRDAFRTISEVAELLDTPAHVLRFWESKFTQVKPVKRAGGRRYYRPGDIALIGGIRKLLHEDGLTIKGVQKVLREQGVKHVSTLVPLPIDDADEADYVEDAPYTEVLAETATVLPFAPVDDESAKASHGDDQTEIPSPGSASSDLPDFVTQSLEDRANDDTVVESKPPEDSAEPPEMVRGQPDIAPEPQGSAEMPGEAETALADLAEDDSTKAPPASPPPEPEALDEQDIGPEAACEDDTPQAPDSDPKTMLEAPGDEHEAETATEASVAEPDALEQPINDGPVLAEEDDAATGDTAGIEGGPDTFSHAQEAQSVASDAGLAPLDDAPLDDAPLTASVEPAEPIEDSPADSHTPSPIIPPIPAQEDAAPAAPGLLAHLAGIDRLSPEQSARLAPQLAALRALLDAPDQGPRK